MPRLCQIHCPKIIFLKNKRLNSSSLLTWIQTFIFQIYQFAMTFHVCFHFRYIKSRKIVLNFLKAIQNVDFICRLYFKCFLYKLDVFSKSTTVHILIIWLLLLGILSTLLKSQHLASVEWHHIGGITSEESNHISGITSHQWNHIGGITSHQWNHITSLESHQRNHISGITSY